MLFCSNPFLMQELYSKRQISNQELLAKLSDKELEQTAIQLSLLRKELPSSASQRLLRVPELELTQELKTRQQIAEFKKAQLEKIESTILDSFVTCPDTLTIFTRV